MSGTKAGGIKAAATNKLRYGNDFFGVIGSKGGRNGHTGGFAAKKACVCDRLPFEHTKPMCAGTLGGTISRRTKNDTAGKT